MTKLVYVASGWADQNHGETLADPISVNGTLWTPVMWHNEEDPMFFKTAGLVEVREKQLDYDSRPEPKTNRYCAKCQKDIHPDSKARIIRVAQEVRIIHPDFTGKFTSWESRLVGMDCARHIGIDWTIPE